jgi:hypothetical protein
MQAKRIPAIPILAVVLAAAIALWAMSRPTPGRTAVMYTLVVGALSGSALQAMTTRGRARLGWLGFALFGWVYLALSLWPLSRGSFRAFTRPTPDSGLFVSETVFELLRPAGLPEIHEFAMIGHAVTAVIAGALGMVAGRAVWGRNERSSAGGTDNDPPAGDHP